MSDLISRQAAIEELRTCYDTETITYTNGNEYINYEQAVELIEQLPSAQPERKKGKWIVVKRHEHYPSGKPYEQLRCPFCKRFDHNGDGNFCGYCGADMRGEQDE